VMAGLSSAAIQRRAAVLVVGVHICSEKQRKEHRSTSDIVHDNAVCMPVCYHTQASNASVNLDIGLQDVLDM